MQNGSLASVNRATTTLNSFGNDFKGKKATGNVTKKTLFRGNAQHTEIGPYISQFLLHPYKYGNIEVDQKILVEGDIPSSTSINGWLDIQRGKISLPPNFTGQKKYIHTPRIIGSYVHNDAACQEFCTAALILAAHGAPLDPNSPNLPNEEGFVTFGLGDIYVAVTEVVRYAFQAAWHHKWMVNLRARPEVYAGRLHHQLEGLASYGINPNNLGNATTTAMKTFNQSTFGNNTALLPLIFPEGSPAHPEYPAGHSTVAGACVTVLKAFFDTSKSLSDIGLAPLHSITGDTLDPYTDSDAGNMSVLSELNKLACNISLGRNMAGVHFRSAGTEGNLLGEKIAIEYLKDLKEIYNEEFPGWNLTKFDGTEIFV
jgi:hypothetical protein